MKNFLHKVLIFSTLLILYFGINMLINYSFYTNQSISIKKTSVLIAGDSHPQLSINPEYFYDAQNIAQSAEPYVLTYWKLKNIFNSYIPDTLVIGIAPHNISGYNDLKFSDERWSSTMFKRSYPIEDYNTLSKTLSVDYFAFYKVLWKQTAFFPIRNHISYIGSYSPETTSNVTDWESAIERHYYNNEQELGISEIAINYLDSIIMLSNSLKTQVILVSNPIYSEYLKNIPSTIINSYDSLIKRYSHNYIVFDRIRVHYPDSLYFNSDHLNKKGSKRYTNELLEYLRKSTDAQHAVIKHCADSTMFKRDSI